MMKKSVTREPSNLLKWVEEQMRLRRELEEQKKKQHRNNESQVSLVDMPYLPEDCVFDIIIRLPLETLLASRCVCKSWYGTVKRRDFVNAHLQRSNTGLIYMTPAVKGGSSSDVGKEASSSAKKNEFNVDAKVLEIDSNPALPWHLFNTPDRFQIKYLEIEDGKSTIKDYNMTCTGQIKAACNGLIVLENLAKGNRLIVMNPVTRELKTIPLGTISIPRLESYGLAFCLESSRYKLVHLFKDGSQISCEIMNVGGGPWRVVDGPPHGSMSRLGSKPVSAIGALHWFPRIDQNEYIVSMPLKDEKFLQIPLPKTGGFYDRVLEIDGVLGFVSHKPCRMDVWILKSLGDEGWAKHHTIVSDDGMRNMIPLYCVGGGGELVFKHDDDLYAYDQHLQLMRKIEVKNEWCHAPSPGCYFPHVNSLISSRIKHD